MQGLKNKISWGLVLFWAGFAQVYWNLTPNITEHNAANIRTSVYLIIKGLTLIGPDLLVLLLGYFLYNRVDKKALVVKIWLNTAVFGCLLSLAIALTDNGINYYPITIFNSMLPILRNSYPLITGVMGGLMIASLFPTQQRMVPQRLIRIIWLLIALPFLTPVNIWGWNDNFLTLFYACLFVLGGNLGHSNNYRWGLVGLGSLVINFLCQGLIPFLSYDGTTINRFTVVTNLFTVLAAYSFAKLLIQQISKPAISYPLSVMVFLSNSSVFAVVYAIAERKPISHSTVATGALALSAISIYLLVAGLWWWLLTTPKVRAINQWISTTTALSFTKQERAALIKRYGPNLLVAAISYAIAAASMLLMNNTWLISAGKYHNIFSYVFTQRELLLLLTTLLLFSATKFIQAISNRYWFSLALIIFINAAFVIANREKIAARNEPVLPVDLSMVKVAGSLFGMVSPILWVGVITGIAILIVAIYWLEKHYPVKLRFKSRQRWGYLLLAPILFGSCVFWNHAGTPINNLLLSIDDKPMFYNQLSGARTNGPLVQFMNNVDVKIMDKPSGYSKARMEQIVKKYQSQAQVVNRYRHNDLKRQTVIFNLNESFSDPSRVPGVNLKNSPISEIKKIQQQNTGGTMISSGYGGGTANMEYMTLTGYSVSNFSPTLPVPYTQLVGKLKVNPSIVDSFNHAVAIHPYIGTFYNRTSVYPKFGFDKFLYLGSKDKIRHQHRIDRSPYLSDQTSYQNVIDQLRSYPHGQFINLVTCKTTFHILITVITILNGIMLLVSPRERRSTKLMNLVQRFTIPITPLSGLSSRLMELTGRLRLSFTVTTCRESTRMTWQRMG